MFIDYVVLYCSEIAGTEVEEQVLITVISGLESVGVGILFFCCLGVKKDARIGEV